MFYAGNFCGGIKKQEGQTGRKTRDGRIEMRQELTEVIQRVQHNVKTSEPRDVKLGFLYVRMYRRNFHVRVERRCSLRGDLRVQVREGGLRPVNLRVYD